MAGPRARHRDSDTIEDMKPIRAAALGTAVVVAGGALVAVVVSQQSEDDTVARDETVATSSASPSASPTVTTFEPLDFGSEPPLEQPYKRLAQQAVADGLVTMVPAALPEEWSSAGAGYRSEDQRWWRIEFAAPSGPVLLDQLAGTPDEVLADHRAVLTAEDDVELDAWGTGTWQHHSSEGATVLNYRLKGSTAVIQAPDLETASTLAKTLLPAEGQATAEE